MEEPSHPYLAATDATIAWCLRNAEWRERTGDPERAACWAYIAAGTATRFGLSHLCSAPLEALLSRLGAALPAVGGGGRRPNPAGRQRWLHVMSESYPIGGHTALARRWMTLSPFGERHSLVLTFQASSAVEPKLAEAVRRSEGTLHSVSDRLSFLERASALRQLAWEEADVVVAHVHTWDVVPALAFAVPGGPPVLLVNHADHSFWVGGAIADLVVDIRDSGAALTKSLRGARGTVVLPIPLEDCGASRPDRTAAAGQLPDPSVLGRGPVLLTIGAARKYQATARLDFLRAARRIVEAVDDSVLIAIGASPADPPWQRLAEQTGGRVVALGLLSDLAPWHAAADLFLESFPVGSYTALLEVALAERAFVRKPILAPPSALPIDRGALAGVEPPSDADVYIAAAIALIENPDRRASLAENARRAVLADHCGSGWHARLDAVRRAIPPGHEVGLAYAPPPMPGPFAEYWASVRAAATTGNAAQSALELAFEAGLEPKTDGELRDATL